MTNYELVVKFVDASYEKYGSYSHAAGVMQSALANILDGYSNAEDIRKLLVTLTPVDNK